MDSGERRSRDAARLKRKILAAAVRVLAEQGYGNVSMRKIAARIGYSPTTIYRFFRNKEDLLGTIAAETRAGLAARFDSVREEGGDPLDRLRSLVAAYVTFCIGRPHMYRLLSDLATFEIAPGAVVEVLAGRRFPVFESWLGAVRQCVGAGRLRDTDEIRIFLYLWDATHGYIEHRISRAVTPAVEDVPAYLDLVFRGIETGADASRGGRSR